MYDLINNDGFNINTYQFQILSSAPGMGGESIESLMNTSGEYYQRLIADVQNGKRLANAQGKTYSCTGISWI